MKPYDFSERCKIKQITNFVSIIQQNMKLWKSNAFELKEWEQSAGNEKM